MGEKLSETEALQTDGTTKFGEHYGRTLWPSELRNQNQKLYTLLVCDMFSLEQRKTLQKLLKNDIDSVQLGLGKECASSKRCIIKENTMSSAAKLFNELLENYRADILPSVAFCLLLQTTDNWTTGTI